MIESLPTQDGSSPKKGLWQSIQAFIDRICYKLRLPTSDSFALTTDEVKSIAKESMSEINELDGKDFIKQYAQTKDLEQRRHLKERWEDRVRKREIAEYGHPLM